MTTVARTTVLTVTVDGVGPVPVTVTGYGDDRRRSAAVAGADR